MAPLDDTALAALLRALPPAPSAWVEAAAGAPRVRRQLDEVLPRLSPEARARAAETAAFEQALREAGAEPDPQLVAAARRRLQREAGER